jgi:PAS domain S-box-containing protein
MMKQWHILVPAAVLSLIVGLAGYFYYMDEYRSITKSREYEITTIGTLKIDQIEQWHREKMGDARVMLNSTFIHSMIGNLVHHPTDTAMQAEIRRHLNPVKVEFGFENIFFSTPEGKLLSSLDTAFTTICPDVAGKIMNAAKKTDITTSDFYFCSMHQRIHFDFFAPLRDRSGRVLAVITFRLDPNMYLYPLVQSWPTPSKTAETMLLRRSDDSVIFLNELRHVKNTALKKTMPLNKMEFSSAQGVPGYNGIYRGIDYRGVPVIGFIGPIPGTTWLLVAKVDTAEIFSELDYRAAITGILTLVLILLVFSGSAFFYNSRQKNLYLTLFEKEKEFHERLEEFKTILYSIGDGVVTTDVDGRIMQMNHAAGELTGWSESDAQGRPFRDVITMVNEYTRERVTDPITRVLTEGVIIGVGNHTLLIAKDGKETPIADSGAPITNDRGMVEGTVLIFRNKTEEHRAEEERKRLEYQLFRSQRAESIGTLAAGIAHDFNNILNVIVGNAELLASSPLDPEKTPRRIASIIKASERGTNVVRQLLAVARKTDIQHLPLNVNDIILELSKLLFETFPKTVAITLELMPGLPSVDGDANQLHQVLLNLSVNARDAMSEGGTLSFKTSVVSGSSLTGRFSVARPIDYLRVSVTDTGEGMNEATTKQIFDPFFTTKEKGKGTGLGLAVAQGIVDSHEGFIDVHSQPGAGTRFDLYLPAVPASQFVEPASVDPDVEEPGGNETILYIEDEELILDITVDLLESHGYQILTAGDGEQGVERFRENRERIDLVLSDYGLPKFDGTEVYKRIRKMDAEVPFAILTGYMSPEKRAELMDLGVSEIISKPHKPGELLALIRKLLGVGKT